jgi:hypothetical protein
MAAAAYRSPGRESIRQNGNLSSDLLPAVATRTRRRRSPQTTSQLPRAPSTTAKYSPLPQLVSREPAFYSFSSSSLFPSALGVVSVSPFRPAQPHKEAGEGRFPERLTQRTYAATVPLASVAPPFLASFFSARVLSLYLCLRWRRRHRIHQRRRPRHRLVPPTSTRQRRRR